MNYPPEPYGSRVIHEKVTFHVPYLVREMYYDEIRRDFMHHLNFHFYVKKLCILNRMSLTVM